VQSYNLGISVTLHPRMQMRTIMAVRVIGREMVTLIIPLENILRSLRCQSPIGDLKGSFHILIRG